MGESSDDFGPRFPDMSKAYTEYRATAHEVAKKLGIKLDEGVYIGVTGPTYETPVKKFVPIRHWEQMRLVCLPFLKLFGSALRFESSRNFMYY